MNLFLCSLLTTCLILTLIKATNRNLLAYRNANRDNLMIKPSLYYQNPNRERYFRTKRLAIKDQNKKWLNGNVPFIISEQFSSDDKKLILTAIENYERYTCIHFKQKQPLDKDYVVITTGQGCSSPVGRQRGAQNVTLGDGCLYLHTILHELMHSIGFEHEHNRPDRDHHIIIHRENIRKVLYKHYPLIQGMEYAFKKRKWDDMTALGFDYDYNSVMQYDETSFSKNGKPTMEAKTGGVKLGSKSGFSENDIKKINIFYQCLNESQFTEQISDTNDGCLSTLKWEKYNPRNKKLTDDMIGAGNDSYGNKFYICRCYLISEQIIPGLMFGSFCYITYNETEYQMKEFEVLIKPINSSGTIKWVKVWALHHKLPDHSVMSANEAQTKGEQKLLYIGRCYLKFAYYSATIIGKVIATDNYVGLIRVPFNGREIMCHTFDMLTCN